MARKPAFISHSREREAEIQRRLQDVLEARFRRLVAGEIARESERLLSAYRELGTVPPKDDGHYTRVRDIYFQMDHASIRAFGSRVLVQGKSAGRDLETKSFADLFEAFARVFINLEAVRRRITSVTDTTRNNIIAAVQRGFDEGLGLDEIANLVMEQLPQRSRIRAVIIARTEVHAASNYGAHQAAKETGLDLSKEWVSVEDHRTRGFDEANGQIDEYDHRSMSGQTVGMDEPFIMPHRNGTFVQCQFPGDPALPPAASINCRCASVHVVNDLD